MQLNTKVILKPTRYSKDKYNPTKSIGVVVSKKEWGNPIIVQWENGIRNCYKSDDLHIYTPKK
jgi:hypothetical protein